MKRITLIIIDKNDGRVGFKSPELEADYVETIIISQGNIGALNMSLAELKTDFVMVTTTDFQLAYDDALYDAIILSDGNEVTGFGCRYDADDNNKYDPQWRHPLCNPALSSVINRPCFFLCFVLSRECCQGVRYEGENIYEALVAEFVHQLANAKRYAFVPLDVLSAECHSEEINEKIDRTVLKERFYSENALLASDYKYVFDNCFPLINEENMVLAKLGKTRAFRGIMALRKVLRKAGYYKWKANKQQLRYLKQVEAQDKEKIAELTKKIKELPPNLLHPKGDETDIIVSLTTHGERFSNSAPFAIYSIFVQSVLPGRIVVSVDQDRWNDDNLPPLIKLLQKSGLEVLYCRDVRSHTKLLPALAKYKNNPIITVDDDMFYEPMMIEELVNAYKLSDKKTVICRQGVFPIRKDGKYLPYMKWIESSVFGEKANLLKQQVSPFGVSGVLYPPNVFDDEVFNEEVFLKQAPHTDDIWFWLMEVRNGIKTQLICDAPYDKDVSVSMMEYLVESESTALYFQNCFNGRNDREMYALLDYYNM